MSQKAGVFQTPEHGPNPIRRVSTPRAYGHREIQWLVQKQLHLFGWSAHTHRIGGLGFVAVRYEDFYKLHHTGNGMVQLHGHFPV